MAHRKVQIWIYHQSRVLLLQTTTVRGSFWQPVTGSVEEGESFEEAAEREAREETDLEFAGKLLDLDYEISFEGRQGAVVERCFGLEAKSESVTIDPKEHQGFQWVAREQAFGFLKYESNAEALKKLPLAK